MAHGFLSRELCEFDSRVTETSSWTREHGFLSRELCEFDSRVIESSFWTRVRGFLSKELYKFVGAVCAELMSLFFYDCHSKLRRAL